MLLLILCLASDSKANTKQIPQQELISLSVQNIKVRDLLQIIAKRAKKNIIISSQVTENISIELSKVTWEEALASVLKLQNLTKITTPNVIFIAPNAEIKQREATENKLPFALKLHYAEAQDLEKILKPTGILSNNSGISADPRTNTLLISDVATNIANVGQLVHAIDNPLHQILIEARIVCIDADYAHELGAKFGTHKTEQILPRQKINLDLPLDTMETGVADISILKLANTRTLDLVLAALESEGKAKVISSPKLITTERQAAYIESGSEIPYQEKTSGGATNVAFKKAVLSLKVTPEIVSTNKINLALELNQDKVSQMTVNGVPAIDTRKIVTQVSIQNRDTIVLGGIYEWANAETITRVPYIGKIPLIGMLFTNKEKKQQRKELLMFVTPIIK
ncbi:MAG: type IV pilus secretin PilQ [Gammaproteobacteria bacterium]|nr:type IV pilus secretin PilQ [Gammaproteobacteria bacterium]